MFKPDNVSRDRLKLVHPDLARVYLNMAAGARSKPTRIVCGARTIAEQKVLLRLGKTRTLKSKHLPQRDGYSHAIDLVLMRGKEPDWEAAYEVADWMREAAQCEEVDVTWGVIWEKPLNQIGGNLSKAALVFRNAFKLKNGRWPFHDGPHFQL